MLHQQHIYSFLEEGSWKHVLESFKILTWLQVADKSRGLCGMETQSFKNEAPLVWYLTDSQRPGDWKAGQIVVYLEAFPNVIIFSLYEQYAKSQQTQTETYYF